MSDRKSDRPLLRRLHKKDGFDMRRFLLSLSILLALAGLTSCGGSTKTVYRDRTVTSIVYRDATTTTTAPELTVTSGSASFCSKFYNFCASFPTNMPSEDPVDYVMDASNGNTGYKGYSTSTYSKIVDGEQMYCSLPNDDCTIYEDYTVRVYLDNPVNREATNKDNSSLCKTFDDFTTVTGVPSRHYECDYGGGIWDILIVNHNGKIFEVESTSNQKGKRASDMLSLFSDFGLSDV